MLEPLVGRLVVGLVVTTTQGGKIEIAHSNARAIEKSVWWCPARRKPALYVFFFLVIYCLHYMYARATLLGFCGFGN